MREPISVSELIGNSVIRKLINLEVSAGNKCDRFNESSLYIRTFKSIIFFTVDLTVQRASYICITKLKRD